MALLAELDAAPDTIEAELIYLAKPEKLVTYVARPGDVDQREGGENVIRRVRLHNGRPLADKFEFEREGFRFVPHHSRVADFLSDDEVRRTYYKECQELIKQVSGAKRVVVFDHTLRTASSDERETKKIRDIVSRVHNDYTEWSGPQRVRDMMGDEAETLLRGRFAIIQVWRPINHPVESHPLAICDAQTVKPRRSSSTSAAIPTGSARPMRSPTTRSSAGTGSRICAPTKLWCSRSTSSLKDGRARWTAHTAFKDPTARRTPAPAKASKSARWRFLRPSGPLALRSHNSGRDGSGHRCAPIPPPRIGRGTG